MVGVSFDTWPWHAVMQMASMRIAAVIRVFKSESYLLGTTQQLKRALSLVFAVYLVPPAVVAS